LGPESRRILLATVLSVGILLGWQWLFPQPKPPAKPATPAAEQARPAEGGAPPQAAAPGAAGSPAPAAPAVEPDAPEETVKLDGPGFHALLTSHGGAVKSMVLEGERFVRETDGKTVAIDLVRVVDPLPYPLAVVASPELGGPQEIASGQGGRAPMRIVSRGEKEVVFEGKAGQATVRKTYRVTGKPHELALEVDVTAPAVSGGAVYLVHSGFMPPGTGGGGFFSGPPLDFVRPICRGGEKTERYDVKGGDPVLRLDGPVQWAGIDQHYFVAAALPAEPVSACVFQKGPKEGSALVAMRVPVESGARKMAFTVYAGPKELDTLRAYGRNFDAALDYGAFARPFAFFARMLLYVMRWIEGFASNWGVAIILLTVLVKLLLYPLTAKSMQSMAEMRKLQPEMEKLKAKYGDDKEQLNRAVMQMYQQHKVNPLGGCLPLLLQMPIWFALYATLQTSVELYREPFLWMKDLTQHDPFFILPIAMGLSQYLMQRISPQPADNAQAKMMLYFMPGFFTVLMLFVPGGLTLYIFVNNVLSIAQQQWMLRKMPPAPAPAKAKG
jgi:YidC/Oxa1 family membrane protein insertase